MSENDKVQESLVNFLPWLRGHHVPCIRVCLALCGKIYVPGSSLSYPHLAIINCSRFLEENISLCYVFSIFGDVRVKNLSFSTGCTLININNTPTGGVVG